jgi:hypothetical protein
MEGGQFVWVEAVVGVNQRKPNTMAATMAPRKYMIPVICCPEE